MNFEVFSVENIESIVKTLTMIAAGLGAAIGIWKSVSKISSFLSKQIASANKQVAEILNLSERVSEIHRELKPNGGSSIKDSVNRIESRLLTQEYKIQSLFSHLKIANFEADKTGKFTYVSKHWQELTGLSWQESMGNNWISCVEESDRERIFDLWQDSIKEDRNFYASFKLAKDKQSVTCVSIAKKNEKGGVEGFFGNVYSSQDFN